MTFEQAMALTSTVANVHSLQVEECRALWEALQLLPAGATVVEIGLDVGRSSSLIFQAARERNFLTIHIDPWQWHPNRAKDWMAMMSERCAYHPFILFRMTTGEAAAPIIGLTPAGIDLAFIDGSHDYADVRRDLENVASRVRSKGFLAAHDYPSGGVSEAINPFVADGWTKHAQAMGLGIWRRQ